MPKLFLVRHAEPAVTGVLLGRGDPPLSDRGRLAAAGLRLPVEIVYSSPLRRAFETAAMCGAPVHVLDELVEISYGTWDGKAWIDIERTHPDLAARKHVDWRGVTPPGGEPWVVFASRARNALQRIRAGPLPAAVVAHLAVNAEIAFLLCGGDPLSFQQDYCEVLEYEV